MKTVLIFILIFGINTAFAQTFEGSITYKMVVQNPFPDKVPDSLFQKILVDQFGEKGYMVQKYFYKQGNYISEIEAGKVKGFQALNPKDGQLYSWEENSDTAITINSKKFIDEFVEIRESELKDTVLGIPCKSIIVKSKMGEMTLYYNSDYFKMDSKYFKGHKYGHWEQILKKTGCLPLKMQQQSFMAQTVQTAIEYKEIAVPKEKFKIPKFKVLIKTPVN